jgi:peptide/nickel transport system substrate-binding protein
MGVFPDSLDPQYGYTTQAADADYLVYTPLLTFAHESGVAGTRVIPGLATGLPVVTDGGETYTLYLRRGLRFSDGTLAKASDFTFAIERALRLSWGGDPFYTENIVGASAYQSGKAHMISGITSDDATGKIVIRLVRPYGAFEDVLALPSSAPVPSTTPMKVLSTDPPPGIGSYEIIKVDPNVGFVLQRNPLFPSFHIPGIPTGSVDTVRVTVQSNGLTEAEDVLDNVTDVFDWGDTIPSSLLARIKTEAKGRYREETSASTDFFFLNTQSAPFDNVSAREAVNLAINRVSLAKLASGQLTPACFFLPSVIPGHASGPCPEGSPTATGSPADIDRAKVLVSKAGLDDVAVTVWTSSSSPEQGFGTYLVSVLDQIGFRASLRVLAGSVYFETTGNAATDPQIGYGTWIEDFPNPSDFYLLLDARDIQRVNNENLSKVDDRHIQQIIERLDTVPASKLSTVASQWSALERYVAGKYYMAVFGHGISPFFVSSRIDTATTVFNPLFGDDWSTFQLKPSRG